VEVIEAGDMACVVVVESQAHIQGGRMGRLMRRELTEYDYVSVSKDGFVPIRVRLTMNATRLTNDMV
jgi:hypothetical protein